MAQPSLTSHPRGPVLASPCLYQQHWGQPNIALKHQTWLANARAEQTQRVLLSAWDTRTVLVCGGSLLISPAHPW